MLARRRGTLQAGEAQGQAGGEEGAAAGVQVWGAPGECQGCRAEQAGEYRAPRAPRRAAPTPYAWPRPGRRVRRSRGRHRRTGTAAWCGAPRGRRRVPRRDCRAAHRPGAVARSGSRSHGPESASASSFSSVSSRDSERGPFAVRVMGRPYGWAVGAVTGGGPVSGSAGPVRSGVAEGGQGLLRQVLPSSRSATEVPRRDPAGPRR
jgi:hypothetical protein